MKNERRRADGARHNGQQAAYLAKRRMPDEIVRDALARIVYLREALELGDVGTAATIAGDLEHDLVASLAELEGRA